MSDTRTPRERFLDAIAEALNHYNETAADEFGFDFDSDTINVEFYDSTGAPSGMVTADLSTIAVTKEN